MEGFETKHYAHSCACGANCACVSNCQCGPAEASDLDVYDLSLPRRVPAEILEMEEQERQFRMSKQADPVLYAKLYKVQTELMHQNIPTTLLNDVRSEVLGAKQETRQRASSFSDKMQELGEKISGFASGLIDSMKIKESEIEAKTKPMIDQLDEKSQQFAVSVNQRLNNWKDASIDLARDVDEKKSDLSLKTSQKIDELQENLRSSATMVTEKASTAMGELKGKLGAMDPSSMAAEEKERALRMNAKVDPMVDARKAVVQRELMNSVNTVNSM